MGIYKPHTHGHLYPVTFYVYITFTVITFSMILKRKD